MMGSVVHLCARLVHGLFEFWRHNLLRLLTLTENITTWSSSQPQQDLFISPIMAPVWADASPEPTVKPFLFPEPTSLF